MTFEGDYPSGAAVGIALDIFHSSIGISELEDFIIDPGDPNTKEILEEAEGYESYSATCDGEVARIGEALDLT